MNKIKISLFERTSKSFLELKQRYIKQYEKNDKERENKYDEMSSSILMKSNVNNINEENLNLSLNKTKHNGIKCQKCSQNPIIGCRYKCAFCKDYNLCEKCEEQNF